MILSTCIKLARPQDL